MLECMIIGDSIAVGLSMAQKECVSISRGGITSEKWYKSFGVDSNFRKPYKVVAISLGTNDYRVLEQTFFDIRVAIDADLVVWILPNSILKPTQRAMVEKVAKQFGDKTVDITKDVGPDMIHPSSLQSYKSIAKKIF